MTVEEIADRFREICSSPDMLFWMEESYTPDEKLRVVLGVMQRRLECAVAEQSARAAETEAMNVAITDMAAAPIEAATGDATSNV